MKIGVISNLYPPYQRGGAERIVGLGVQALKEAGHDVFVISTKPQGSLDIAEELTRTYRFKPVNIFYYLDDHKHNILVRFIWNIFDIFNIFSAITVAKILSQEKPDLIITHNLKGIGLNLPLVITHKRIKHYHIAHDIQLVNPSGLLLWGKEDSFFETGWMVKIYQALLRKYFSHVDKVFFPSIWLKEYYEKYSFFSNSNKIILRNPCPDTDIPQKSKETRLKTFLFLGQIEKHKGIHWLLDFWVKNKIPAKLLVAGKGNFDLAPYREKENLEIIGYVDREQIVSIFKRSDFLIFPSLCYENSPTVLIEAFQYATPVIAANIGGTTELVVPGINGYVFDPVNENQLLQHINTALSLSDTEYATMSQNALETVNDLTSEFYIENLLAGLS